MYRPTKKKMIRRVSVASVVAVLAGAGFAATVFSQGGTTNSASRSTTQKDAPASTSSATTSSAKYHLVGAIREGANVDE
ncbi:MAG TPA: hypothetical protein VIJ86_01430 [Acidimicrobiales bacterium]